MEIWKCCKSSLNYFINEIDAFSIFYLFICDEYISNPFTEIYGNNNQRLSRVQYCSMGEVN